MVLPTKDRRSPINPMNIPSDTSAAFATLASSANDAASASGTVANTNATSFFNSSSNTSSTGGDGSNSSGSSSHSPAANPTISTASNITHVTDSPNISNINAITNIIDSKTYTNFSHLSKYEVTLQASNLKKQNSFPMKLHEILWRSSMGEVIPDVYEGHVQGGSDGNNGNDFDHKGGGRGTQREKSKTLKRTTKTLYSEAIIWLPHGRAWKVLNPNILVDKVLPLYFNHKSKAVSRASFLRQVNNWCFKRVLRGVDVGAYYHEKFLRGLPHVSFLMQQAQTLKSNSQKCASNTKKTGGHPRAGSQSSIGGDTSGEGSDSRDQQIYSRMFDVPPDFEAITAKHPLPEACAIINGVVTGGGASGGSSAGGAAATDPNISDRFGAERISTVGPEGNQLPQSTEIANLLRPDTLNGTSAAETDSSYAFGTNNYSQLQQSANSQIGSQGNSSDATSKKRTIDPGAAGNGGRDKKESSSQSRQFLSSNGEMISPDVSSILSAFPSTLPFSGLHPPSGGPVTDFTQGNFLMQQLQYYQAQQAQHQMNQIQQQQQLQQSLAGLAAAQLQQQQLLQIQQSLWQQHHNQQDQQNNLQHEQQQQQQQQKEPQQAQMQSQLHSLSQHLTQPQLAPQRQQEQQQEPQQAQMQSQLHSLSQHLTQPQLAPQNQQVQQQEPQQAQMQSQLHSLSQHLMQPQLAPQLQQVHQPHDSTSFAPIDPAMMLILQRMISNDPSLPVGLGNGIGSLNGGPSNYFGQVLGSTLQANGSNNDGSSANDGHVNLGEGNSQASERGNEQ